jgi:hypothetical protein
MSRTGDAALSGAWRRSYRDARTGDAALEWGRGDGFCRDARGGGGGLEMGPTATFPGTQVRLALRALSIGRGQPMPPGVRVGAYNARRAAGSVLDAGRRRFT